MTFTLIFQYAITFALLGIGIWLAIRAFRIHQAWNARRATSVDGVDHPFPTGPFLVNAIASLVFLTSIFTVTVWTPKSEIGNLDAASRVTTEKLREAENGRPAITLSEPAFEKRTGTADKLIEETREGFKALPDDTE